MKAILIDPFDQCVSEVDYNGDYKEIYKLINEPDKKMYIWKYYEDNSTNISRIEYFVNY